MQAVMPKAKVLFLCTGNSCRSQMAEGFARARWGGKLETFSAGTVAKGLDPRAVAVMAEVDVDISGQRSKTLDDLRDSAGDDLPDFDLVITVCADAHEVCPRFPGKACVIHRGFDDPPALVRKADSEEEALYQYSRVRDEIRAFIETLPALLEQAG